MSESQDAVTDDPEVTIPWLRKETLALLRLARQAEEVDHAVCFRYLEFLLKLGVKAPTPAPGTVSGQQVRDLLWQEESSKKNGVVR